MKRRRAFSLLEVVVAVMIYATVAVLLIGMWVTHHRALHKARMTLIAGYVAQQEMEKLRSLDLASIVPSSGDVRINSIIRGVPQSAKFHHEVVTSNEGVNGTMTSVRVEVSWQEGPETRKLVIEHMRYQYIIEE
ncbi:MAG: type II secretion system protein [Candidatus Eremiobacterota bacterium]